MSFYLTSICCQYESKIQWVKVFVAKLCRQWKDEKVIFFIWGGAVCVPKKPNIMKSDKWSVKMRIHFVVSLLEKFADVVVDFTFPENKKSRLAQFLHNDWKTLPIHYVQINILLFVTDYWWITWWNFQMLAMCLNFY